jgi:ribosome-associated toxin RatA of RatAB toxin-antitoxin module
VRIAIVTALVPDRDPADVYTVLADFARYPLHCDAVQSVDVWTGPDGALLSGWLVHFRSGLLRWTEQDVLDPDRHRIEFAQVEGDAAAFAGSWQCTAVDGGTSVTFTAAVDLGIPSLADVLDPIAARTLVQNTADILTGLLGPDVRIVRTSPEPMAVAS